MGVVYRFGNRRPNPCSGGGEENGFKRGIGRETQRVRNRQRFTHVVERLGVREGDGGKKGSSLGGLFGLFSKTSK